MSFGTRSVQREQGHRFEFRGSGTEFFGIWIVNIALTLITLGIFSAWAKVRSRRYFYGNTFVAGHAFDYHAAPLRILFGRLIALALFIAYNISVGISPLLAIPWLLIALIAIPWLIVLSLRFNARNTSYRNVRFNFTGTYMGALEAAVLWRIAGFISAGLLMPLAHRARDYYYINHHTYGGKRFATSFGGWDIYKIYLIAFGLFVGGLLMAGIVAVILFAVFGFSAAADQPSVRALAVVVGVIGGAAYFLFVMFLYAFVGASTFNLAVGNTTLDNRHKLQAELSPWAMCWIALSNVILVLVTIGLYYPWARVRVARYMAGHMSLVAASNLDEFTSEAQSAQNAVGEEIAGFFDFDIGL